MFIGIDGSSDSVGAQSDQEYDAIYRNSFVRELYNTTRHENKSYVHGPDLFSVGREVVRISGEIVSYIQGRISTTDDRIIVLAGHSRGGAVCVNVAQRLQRESWSAGLEIQCMALFDAIDRDIATATEVIPDNVVRAFHAMRDPRTGSRPSFGNTATMASARILSSMEFMTTHSGIGGIALDRLAGLIDVFSDQPVISAEEEVRNIRLVKAWMWRNIRRDMRIYEPTDTLHAVTSTSPLWRRISHQVTEEAEIARVQAVFQEMEIFRQSITLPEARTLQGLPTISKLEIPNVDRVIYGVSRSSTSPSGISREEIANLKSLLEELYGTAPHRVVVEHAEADAIIDAWNNNITAETATMYADRPLCHFCAGSLRRLIPLIGLQQLTVYQLQPESGTIFRAIIMSVT